jgi:hypothetical protein
MLFFSRTYENYEAFNINNLFIFRRSKRIIIFEKYYIDVYVHMKHMQYF